MTTKIVQPEMDAVAKLAAARWSAGESLSAVLRRAHWKPDAQTKRMFAKYGVPYAARMQEFFDAVFHPKGPARP